MATQNTIQTLGPVEARIRWELDPEPHDPGDTLEDATSEETREFWSYVSTWGVYGCIIEIRRPVCACCEHSAWEVAGSLWGIVGDDAYHREVERDLMAEVAAA